MAEQTDIWRAVAIALRAELAEHGYDPNSPAVRAYNHARNGRWDQAKEALS